MADILCMSRSSLLRKIKILFNLSPIDFIRDVYKRQQYDNAIACWEHSAAIEPTFPTVWRNLSLAYYNKRNDQQRDVYKRQY